jgi:predicted  nucleic acid-binding Zn-ribbon protein
MKNLLKKLGFISESLEEKSRKMQKILDNDPELKKIDAEISRLHQTHGQLSPEFKEILKKYGAL